MTTVKFRDERLPGLSSHPNFTLIDLSLNNSDGSLPYVDKGWANIRKNPQMLSVAMDEND